MRAQWIRLAGLLAPVLLLPVAGLGAQAPLTILYHEPLVLIDGHQAGGPATLRARDGGERLVFDAFGRRFELLLDNNPRVGGRASTAADMEVFQGEVAGAPGSWVRLTRRGHRLSGLIHDGLDAYAIEPVDAMGDSLLETGKKAGSANVIYRLADALITDGAMSCGMNGDRPAAMNAQAAMDDMVTELAAVTVREAQGADYRVTLSVTTDALFFTGDEAGTEAAVITRINNVDGIYTEQLGIEISLVNTTVFETEAEQAPFFSDTTDAAELLDELAAYREENESQYGLSHLLTGRDFDGTTAGIAFLGEVIAGLPPFGVCHEEYAASASQGSFSETISSLIIAHEIGHNFGAPHDGEDECAATPETFLMAADIDANNDEFSQCSLDQMQPLIDAAKSDCLTAIPSAGVSVTGPASAEADLDKAFELTYTVRSTGNAGAEDVRVQLQVPGSLSLNNLNASSGSCTTSTGSCSLGTIGAGSSRTVRASLAGTAPGLFDAMVSVTAASDDDTGDNDTSTAVTITDRQQQASSGGGGGGGGSAGWPALLALFSAARLRRRSARSVRQQ